MKHKGGNVYGSIYERKRKNGGISYTAEIQFHGQVMRRSSKNRDALQVWTDNVCEKLNSVEQSFLHDVQECLQALRWGGVLFYWDGWVA